MTSITEPSADPAIALTDVTLGYRGGLGGALRPPVSSVTLTVMPGEIVAVVGPSGSGKSTLLRSLAPLGRGERGASEIPRVEGGSVRVLGRTLRGPGRARRRIAGRMGWVAQESEAMFEPEHSVIDAIADPVLRRDRKFDRSELSRRVGALCVEFRIDPSFVDRRPAELSAGNRQRVALAQAMILEPPVLVLDEPLSGVDIRERPALLHALRQRADAGAAVLIGSNQREILSGLADRVVVLDAGGVVGSGTVDEVRAAEHVGGYLRALLDR